MKGIFKYAFFASLILLIACGKEIDNTPPEITLKGNNPMNVDTDSEYVEPGATVIDDVDGDISDQLIIVGDVDTSTEGTYYIKYNAIDNAGNQAEEKIREVRVMTF